MSAVSSKYIFISLTALALTACGGSQPPQPVEQPETTSMRQQPAGAPGGTIAVGHGESAPSSAPMGSGAQGGSVNWTPPAKWQAGPERQMRAATYLIPAAAGDSEGAECAVFKDIGGGVTANIERWIGQFEQPDGSDSQAKAKRKVEQINGFNVTSVDLTGTYTASGMSMGGGATSRKTGYRLLGAIVETPSGEVFFKITGPEKTVAAAQADFQALLKSIKN